MVRLGFGDDEAMVRNAKGFFLFIYVFYFMFSTSYLGMKNHVFGNGYFMTEMSIEVEWLLVYFLVCFLGIEIWLISF